MDNYTRCVNLVKQYYAKCMESGLSPVEVMDTFAQPVLPSDLKTSGFTNSYIRRCGQLVGTEYIVQNMRTNTRQIVDL